MNNEKGVILPLTLVLSFFFLLLFSHQLILYVNEKKFLVEIEGVNNLESIMQMGVKDILNELSSFEELKNSVNGTYIYPNGSAHYSLNPEPDNKIRVELKVQDDQGRMDLARFFYSIELKKVLNWVEIG